MTISVPSPDDLAVFCDFDGTLVPIAATPSGVQPPAGLAEVMRDAHQRLRGAFGLVTGRTLENLGSFVDIRNVSAAGCHGAQWQMPPDYTLSELDNTAELLKPAVGPVQNFAAKHDLIVEDKKYSLAIHFRNKPDMEASVDEFLNSHVDFSRGLKLVRGKCIREIKPKHVDKGVAIARFMSSNVFAGRTPVFLGDDTTDEDGFAWVNDNHGISIKVGTGNTQARHRLDGCTDVLLFLQSIAYRRS